MAEGIGSSISEKVHTQISKREALHASTSRSKAALNYLNSSNAWIRLRSSVNTISNSEAESLLKQSTLKSSVPGSNELARSLVLTGGVLTQSTENQNNPDVLDPGGMRSGISYASKTSAGSRAYHVSKTTGFKPMPGIISATVKAKNTFGTLKEASVKFKVFSKEDLDDIERLYFRVGYGALLEWGHSVYVDNSGNVKTPSGDPVVPDTTWFNGTAPGIVATIDTLRNQYDGNYDGMYGYITNFNWTLGNDGTYDCSVKIISKGVILEGLKASNVTTHASAEDQKNDDQEEGQQEAKSVVHFISERLEKIKKEDGLLKRLLTEAKASSIANKFRGDWPTVGFRASVGEGNYAFTRLFYNSSVFVNYIPLGALLDIVNTFELMKDHHGNVICGFETDSQEKYVTFAGHYSCDPLNVFIPKKASGSYPFANFSLTSPKNDIIGKAQKALAGKESYCTSIMISTYYLKDKMDTFVENPVEPGEGIFEFIKSVLAGINFALGGINNLDLFYDDEKQTYTVYDRSFPTTTSRPKEIQVSGLSSTVHDIKVDSKITSEMASMVSIAAQGNTADYNDNLSNILKFNAGCVDRHALSKGQDDKGGDKTESTDDAKKEPFKERFEKAWKNLNEKEVINPVYWSELYNEASAELKRAIQLDNAKNKKPNGLPVPIELSIGMKGISGFKIASTFTINTDIVPRKYKDFAFYIVGVDHEIGREGWKTNLRAKMRNI